ncbi:glycosyltransferase family 4 protein [Phycicoccus sp. CSK15P-2]|uniref:glycosyltransferase family 4 protein n=1 Tax=Phycicoccus sp. CSK15P-2 TaxID=2807627 RepID=UPI0019505714|nr:glycosyltransferase family 4 protein [Phycicoccus sp. CSK15P-2]MBM6405927.1 glycosyltransferase family 4 protein [Phycicoccus sp. CSK15P-2]
MSEPAAPALGGSDAALRVAVVGPSHPFKGGVASHTTTLAHELADAGHDVTLVSWSHLYPSALYPGEQAVPGGAPDVDPFPRTLRVLSWARPDTWVRTGRRLRDVDVIVVVHVVPVVVPAHLALLRAAGAIGGAGHRGPRVVVIAHNVLPHEPHPGDRQLVGSLVHRADAVVVHSDEQARVAAGLGAHRVREVDLPPHLPGGPPEPRPEHDGPVRLLSLGIVRDYKGVDLLVDALRDVGGVTLTVAGELWGEAGRRVRELAADPRLGGRVEVHGGYVPADRIAGLLARHDVLALPYRSATASQNVLLARRHGLPVLVTSVGTFPRQVRYGVDGLVVPPGDRDALVDALRRLAEPGVVAGLAAEVREPDLSGPWANYVGAIEALAAEPSLLDDGAEASAVPLGPLGRARATVAGLRARRGPVLELNSQDLPEALRSTELLTVDAEAVAATEVARSLGLPRAKDPVAAWAALGAIAALVRILDDPTGTAVVVDESGSGSPFSRWARALGFAPVELELTGRRAAVEVLDVDTASLDVLARLHPGGCTASDVDHVVGQASWALRSGGLLAVTVPIGDDDPDFAVRPADLRGVLARADDLGLALVGDVDGDVLGRMREARDWFGDSDSPAYAVLRLVFRRR